MGLLRIITDYVSTCCVTFAPIEGWTNVAMHGLQVLERLSRRIARAEPYRAEVFLSLCSLWAARSLWEAPTNLLSGNHLWMSQFDGNDTHWALLISFAAAAKIIGLLCIGRKSSLGLSLRVTGLAISGFFGSGLAFLPSSLAVSQSTECRWCCLAWLRG